MKKEKLKILYEDKFIIVVYKKTNLLTIGTDKEREKTLFHEVLEYEKKKNKNNKIFIVHRLDKDTEGLVIFAKDIKTKNILQQNWDDVVRKYVALVHGHVHNKTYKNRKAYQEIKQYYLDKPAYNCGVDVTNYEPVTLDEMIRLKEENQDDPYIY